MTAGEDERLLPVIDDPDTAGHWAAAARGEVAVRTCHDCGTVLHMPRAHCFSCGGDDTFWRTVPGRARLYSWTVVEHQVHPAYPVPYTAVIVELEEPGGVRLGGYLPGRPELRADQPMRVRFENLGDGTVLPQWEPVPGEES
ncbi:Zn-ribbon domain-containing OB-fold protein [Actinomadura sp. SCN-SB]|uniref:Zn-ribbon domain-containing OB-fold protein n=1 Tax=Actinomadura sp. SCN-SB TaxID=3373092 RepID=UPI0037537E8B